MTHRIYGQRLETKSWDPHLHQATNRDQLIGTHFFDVVIYWKQPTHSKEQILISFMGPNYLLVVLRRGMVILGPNKLFTAEVHPCGQKYTNIHKFSAMPKLHYTPKNSSRSKANLLNKMAQSHPKYTNTPKVGLHYQAICKLIQQKHTKSGLTCQKSISSLKVHISNGSTGLKYSNMQKNVSN